MYKMMAGEQRNPDYRWRCRGCSKMFTVRTGTIFEETRLPLRVWVYAIWKACSSKKGISALQLSREMEITHKSALFILRRIRHGLGELTQPKLTGTIEVDEVYVGPRRPRYKGISKQGRGTLKTPVVGMVQRGGDVRFQMLERITADQLNKFIAENADLSCRMITDEFNLYNKVGRKFEGGHHVVRTARNSLSFGTAMHMRSYFIKRVQEFAGANEPYIMRFEVKGLTDAKNDFQQIPNPVGKLQIRVPGRKFTSVCFTVRTP